mmetsp:Transcript_2597/g.10007  ORF Transcript_2597/g.10007 Transcript_2597/m.10007 type:complete len:246 (-) Transcript_2597:479-1216(-)
MAATPRHVGMAALKARSRRGGRRQHAQLPRERRLRPRDASSSPATADTAHVGPPAPAALPRARQSRGRGVAAERCGRRRGTRRLLLGAAARAEAPKPHSPQQLRAPLRATASQHIVLQVAAAYGFPFCDVSRSPPFANPSAWSNGLHAIDWRQLVLYRHDVHLDIRVARVLGEASGVEDGLRTVWHEVEAVDHATCHGASDVLFGHVNAPGEDAVLVLDAALSCKQSSLVQTRRQQLHSTSHLRG